MVMPCGTEPNIATTISLPTFTMDSGEHQALQSSREVLHTKRPFGARITPFEFDELLDYGAAPLSLIAFVPLTDNATNGLSRANPLASLNLHQVIHRITPYVHLASRVGNLLHLLENDVVNNFLLLLSYDDHSRERDIYGGPSS
ncbi:hypothetical protein ACFE04_020595 [Oxalis oulophora]